MPDEITMDPTESDLKVGLEVEYPKAPSWGSDRFKKRSKKSSDLHSRMRSASIPRRFGNTTRDGTVGLEQTSEVLDIEDAADWYADVIEFIEEEWNTPYGYTSLLSGGSTAGLHIHISPLSDEQARSLYDISTTPWAQALFCSAIVSDDAGDDWTVFRNNRYAQMNFDSGRYSAVHRVRNDHWEWRMPEPMTAGNMEIVARFLTLLEQDPDEATRYAQERLDAADDRITSLRRAEVIGIDVEDIPDVRARPYDDDPDFFRELSDEWAAPEIYYVEVPGGDFDADEYFVTESQMAGEVSTLGYEVDANGVYYGDSDSLTPVEDPEIERRVRAALERYRSGSISQSEATDEVKKALKKKKA